jgi:hypothetical protein
MHCLTALRPCVFASTTLLPLGYTLGTTFFSNQWNRFKIIDDPTCPCQTGSQRTQHLIRECTILNKQRDFFMFVPCIAALCIENQHCALGFVNVFTTNAAPTCFGTYVPSSGSVFVLVSRCTGWSILPVVTMIIWCLYRALLGYAYKTKGYY